MNKSILIFLIGTSLLFGCDEEPQTIAERNVVSDESLVEFEEILLLINFKTSDSSYLAIKSVDSISLFVNNKFWAKVSSDTVNTDNLDTYAQNNLVVSPKKLNYLFIAPQTLEEPEFNVAGDFADFLNSTLILDPGDYVCYIESFQVRFNDNSVKKYYPYYYSTFKVRENERTAYVGEIELSLD